MSWRFKKSSERGYFGLFASVLCASEWVRSKAIVGDGDFHSHSGLDPRTGRTSVVRVLARGQSLGN